MSGKQVAQYGLLAALALVLSYIEAQIPAFFVVPGMKLGLTNVVVLAALYRMGNRDALILNGIRITKVVPAPFSLSKVMVPPIVSINFFAIGIPRSVPANFVRLPACSWANGSKICF